MKSLQIGTQGRGVHIGYIVFLPGGGVQWQRRLVTPARARLYAERLMHAADEAETDSAPMPPQPVAGTEE
jgi:hypothetical protein